MKQGMANYDRFFTNMKRVGEIATLRERIRFDVFEIELHKLLKVEQN